MQKKIMEVEHPTREVGWRVKIHKKGIGIIFVFSGNNDSDIIPKTSRYHSEGRELVKMSVLKE